MEPELECFDAQSRKSEGFGELKGGFMVRCSLRLCRESVSLCFLNELNSELMFSTRLLDPKHFLLPLIGRRFPLEVAVGLNGRVWVNAKDIKRTIALVRCIEATDLDGGGLDAEAIQRFLNTLEI